MRPTAALPFGTSASSLADSTYSLVYPGSLLRVPTYRPLDPCRTDNPQPQILRGFARGIKDADPTFRLLPCALQVG